ncbi:LysE family translocator [Nocardia arthritidis]|uniref:LysE family translocator n=1 Tax=Nocardia arthritidis TaxID=228602 RepID=A0A6G9YKK2_9NOCA|nr:LysE family translocator [Nocardia arthritidis]QIS13718.1 LysE family translocator [Nocardia arthritidis]
MIGGFAVTVFIGAMVPGPTTALMIRRSALGGTRAALPIIGGMEIGILFWALASALGVSVLVAASDVAFLVIRVVGAVVLIGLGVQAWRAIRRPVATEEVDEQAVRATKWRAGSIGLLTNLANPKLAVWAFAFYPQFVSAGSNILLTTVLLGLLHMVIDATWFTLLATFVGRARNFFNRTRVRQWLEGVTGTILIALGLRLAVSEI